MTVQSTANKVTFQGNGATTVFPFTFIGVAAADLQLTLVDSLGNITTVPTNQYSVALNAVAPPQVWGVGGSVTYPLSGSPVPVGSSLTISRQVPLTQGTSLQAQGAFYPQAVEQAIDLAVMAIQQVSELQGRAISVPISDPNPPAPLPPAVNRASSQAIFDANGNLTSGIAITGTTVSTAMIPVVTSATLALARTALGLGSLSTGTAGLGLQSGVVAAGEVDVNFPVNVGHNPLTSVDHLSVVMVAGPGSVNLNRANTYWDGFGFWFHPIGGAVTLNINGADQFEIAGITQAVGAGLTIPAGAFVYVTTDAAATGNWRVKGLVVKYAGRTTFLANGTYTPKANLAFVQAIAIGGGGAGGGAAAVGASQISFGGGGASGSWSSGTFTPAQIGASQVVTVPAAAIGVSAGTGNTGGTVSLGALLVAPGGLGGPSSGVVSDSAAGGTVAGGAAGAAGSGTGDTIGQGNAGGAAFGIGLTNNVPIIAGQGAPGWLGLGAPRQQVNSGTGIASIAGNPGAFIGAGGGGALSIQGGAAQAGGSGFTGAVVVDEWVYTV